MCIEDYRLGRSTIAGEKIVAVGNATSVLLLSPSNDRTAIVIGCPNAADVTISMNPGVTDGLGIRLQVGQSPLCLDVQKYGAIVTKGLYAIAAAGTEQICVWETSLAQQ